jgi:hypothetical protein
MTINLLCIGDVVGKPGKAMLADHLKDVVAARQVDLVVCNAENLSGGSGLTPAGFRKLLHYGVDVVTLGDHVYRKLDIVTAMNASDRIVRPANFSARATGRRWTVVPTKSGQHRVGVTCVTGQLFMGAANSPWQAVDEVLAEMPAEVKVRVVDVHAEASSEKIAMGWHLAGRASVAFGTHTHTPTADAQVLAGGTAHISDVGMTGPYDGVLGRRKDRVLSAFTSNMPFPFEVAEGDPRLCGVLVAVEAETGKAVHIERIEVRGRKPQAPKDQPAAGGAAADGQPTAARSS